MRMLSLALAFVASHASAQDLTVQFLDGAPKDSFTLTNTGCPIFDAIFVIDLGGSRGGLIFDVTSTGAGVAVSQPVEITKGYASLSPVQDGDKTLQILVASLLIGDQLSLSADLDDTLETSSQTTVSGSEIVGASVSLELSDRILTSTFETDGAARMNLSEDASICLQS